MYYVRTGRRNLIKIIKWLHSNCWVYMSIYSYHDSTDGVNADETGTLAVQNGN
jgi:hypothetical protein